MKSSIFITLFVLITSFGIFAQQSQPKLSGNLIVFHAGSLSVPMKELAAAFKKLYPDVNFLMESAGSVDCARKVTDLNKPCDIVASADYTVIDKMLIPQYCDWNIRFVANEMCLVYTPKAKYANEINRNNWFDILLRKDVTFSRSDPNADPCGYRSVMTMQLAEKFYKQPGLANRLTDKDNNFIRPKEVDLIPLLETNSVDYIFLYKSVAVQHKLKYLELPPEINLRDPALSGFYNSAVVSINGKEPGLKVNMKGEPMIYGITILKNAPNKPVALAFLEFLLSKDKGMKIMEKNGQPSVIPQKNPRFEKLPESLKPFADR
ncbi:MAG: tungstate ABC transporter substrate-binding protein WtpA [Bacteroidetes bacterium]|nr:tungstate ABC transporter substrate-binding protein WtpA [Bacteroidota bacterium]